MPTRPEKHEFQTSNWVSSFLKSFLNPNRKVRRQTRGVKSSVQLALTTLEDRVTPATLHWVGAAAGGGDKWGTAANWQENVLPASGDRLIFDSSNSLFSVSTNGFAPNNNIRGADEHLDRVYPPESLCSAACGTNHDDLAIVISWPIGGVAFC